MELIALISFAAIVVSWLFAPDGPRQPRVATPTVMSTSQPVTAPA